MPTPLKRFVSYWNNLTAADVARLEEFYTENAVFQDPFNKVQGHAAIKHIFDDMFVRLIDPKFVITETIEQDNRVLLVWDFSFRIKSLKPDLKRTIHGTSLIRFAADGRALSHRDYWDAAGELYEQLPVIGSVMRALKRRMA
ncbi:MAG: nuclear transport factor 2 family protein [Burkholderiales bacterium]|nr:nuclear transport factor 2 family protein [Betaproteobacteria bacterium]